MTHILLYPYIRLGELGSTHVLMLITLVSLKQFDILINLRDREVQKCE